MFLAVPPDGITIGFTSSSLMDDYPPPFLILSSPPRRKSLPHLSNRIHDWLRKTGRILPKSSSVCPSIKRFLLLLGFGDLLSITLSLILGLFACSILGSFLGSPCAWIGLRASFLRPGNLNDFLHIVLLRIGHLRAWITDWQFAYGAFSFYEHDLFGTFFLRRLFYHEPAPW